MIRSMNQWSRYLLLCALLAGTLALFPTPAQAATTHWETTHFFGRHTHLLPGFWVTGEVVEADEASITVQLPNHRHSHGMMRHVSLQVTLEVDSSTILLNEALEPLTVTTLQAGEEVVISPRLVWGNLVARFVYAGEPESLADASYQGRLVEVNGDTLTIRSKREEVDVVVDANTIWYDNGQMERPAELPEQLKLRILGVATEDAEGNDIIRAILVTPGRGY